MEQEDFVDIFYVPLVRPLGNLVILFAQAEWALTELISECDSVGESAALEILKKRDARDVAADLVSRSGLTGFDLAETLEHLDQFWTDKEKRNRYVHDDWFVNIFEPNGAAATRGVPRKKGANVTWDDPKPEDVWALAFRFREHRSVFSISAYKIRKERRE